MRKSRWSRRLLAVSASAVVLAGMPTAAQETTATAAQETTATAAQETTATAAQETTASAAQETTASAATETPTEATPTEAAEEFRDEIVVTARRREENVQTVPISITTFSDTELEARSLSDVSELDGFTPNLHFNTTTGFGDESSQSTISMRGLGQVGIQRLNTDAAVGLYLDGVYVARSRGAVFDLLELERIEVLRGPQGTLFGKNTTGGAISLVTKRPTGDFAARLAATLGEYDRRDVQGSVGGRLGKGLAGSLALLAANRDGFSRSLTTGQGFNDVNSDAGRLELLWQPAEGWSLRLTSDFTRERESGANLVLVDVVQVPIVDFYNRVRLAAGHSSTYANDWVTGRLDQSFSDFPSRVDGDVYGTSVHTAWTAGDLAFESITAYRGYDYSTASDGDGAPVPFAHRFVAEAQDQFSQELQVSGLGAGGRLEWVAGTLYFSERPRAEQRAQVFGGLFADLESLPGPIIAPPGAPPVLCDPGPPPPGVPCFGGAGNPLNALLPLGVFAVTAVDLTTASRAVYGEATYDLTDRLDVTVGLRYTRDDKEVLFRGGEGAAANAFFNEGDWAAWTPRLSVSYQVKPEVMTYFTASRGFKSGGFNQILFTNQLFPFDPEHVWSYEVGFKADLLGRRLRLNQSTFYSDYQDIQFIVAELVDGVPQARINNAGAAEIWGFELELEAQPAAGLTLTAGVGHVDGEITEVAPGAEAPEGARPPKSPDWDVNLGVQYAFAAGGGAMIARADYSWRDAFFNDYQNSPQAAQEAYGLVNVRLLWSPPSDRWDVALFATNLGDEEYHETALSIAEVGSTLAIAGRPREWGLTFQVRW